MVGVVLAYLAVAACSAAAASNFWWALAWARRSGELRLAAVDAAAGLGWFAMAVVYALGLGGYLDLDSVSDVVLRFLVAALGVVTAARRAMRSRHPEALADPTGRLAAAVAEAHARNEADDDT